MTLPPQPLVTLRCTDCRKVIGEMKPVVGSCVVIVCKKCRKRNEFRIS